MSREALFPLRLLITCELSFLGVVPANMTFLSLFPYIRILKAVRKSMYRGISSQQGCYHQSYIWPANTPEILATNKRRDDHGSRAVDPK